MNEQRILVLGIGNLLMGDEGVGVHAVRCLGQESLPSAVTVVDGGTGGFHLLSYFADYDVIVMVDATMDGRPPGTVGVIRPRYASDFPRALTAHDIGLRDLVESAVLLGPLPPIHLVTVSIAGLSGLSLELSPPVRAALPRVVATVRELLAGGVGAEAADAAEATGAVKPADRHA
jgi:hydrogenase maturation protease